MIFARSSRLAGVALAGALALSLPACEAEVAPPVVGGYATAYVDTVPSDIEAYPHVYYEGSYAYLVGDQWYWSGPRGWVVLRGEPAPLVRYRATWGYGRPGYRNAPYYRGRSYAPPARPYNAYPPPAQRVR